MSILTPPGCSCAPELLQAGQAFLLRPGQLNRHVPYVMFCSQAIASFKCLAYSLRWQVAHFTQWKLGVVFSSCSPVYQE